MSPELNTPTEFPVHGIFDNTRLCKGVVQNLLSGAVDIIMTYMITNDGLGLLRPLHPPPPSNVHQAEEVPGARGFINNTSPPGTRVRLGPLDVRMNQNFRTYEGYVNDSGRFLTQMDFFLGGGGSYISHPAPSPSHLLMKLSTANVRGMVQGGFYGQIMKVCCLI